MTGTNWTESLQAGFVCPSDEVFGLSHRRDDPIAEHEMAPGANSLGADGFPAPGLLFLLADAVIGSACIRIVTPTEVIVTTNLHLELHTRPWDGHAVVAGRSEPAMRYHGGAAASALIHAGGQPVVTMSGRFVLMEFDQRAAGRVASLPQPEQAAVPVTPGAPHPLISSPIDATLGAGLVDLGPDEVTMTFVAAPELANDRFGLHGGCGALMGERACDALIRSIAPADREFRPVSISVAFFRPIPADGAVVRCRARIEHRGRQLIAAQAVLDNPHGKPAMVVDLVAAGVPRT